MDSDIALVVDGATRDPGLHGTASAVEDPHPVGCRRIGEIGIVGTAAAVGRCTHHADGPSSDARSTLWTRTGS